MGSVVLNNSGVACLQAGDLATSLDLFRRALQATIGALHPGDGPSVEQVPRPIERVVTQETVLADSLVNSCHVYTRAINLIPMDAAYSQDSLVNTTIVSSIILFNLALVYHVKGLEGFDNWCQARIFKARSLYLKSRTLLAEAGVSLASSMGHPVIDILSMALFNNLGQCAFQLSEYEESQAHFDQLVAFAASVQSVQEYDPETSALLSWHKNMFITNAFALQPPTLAPAA